MQLRGGSGKRQVHAPVCQRMRRKTDRGFQHPSRVFPHQPRRGRPFLGKSRDCLAQRREILRLGYNGNPQAVKGHHSVRNRSIDRKSSAGRDGGFALGHFGCLFPLLLLTECRKPSVVQLRCQSRKCVVVPSPRNSPSQPKSSYGFVMLTSSTQATRRLDAECAETWTPTQEQWSLECLTN